MEASFFQSQLHHLLWIDWVFILEESRKTKKNLEKLRIYQLDHDCLDQVGFLHTSGSWSNMQKVLFMLPCFLASCTCSVESNSVQSVFTVILQLMVPMLPYSLVSCEVETCCVLMFLVRLRSHSLLLPNVSFT